MPSAVVAAINISLLIFHILLYVDQGVNLPFLLLHRCACQEAKEGGVFELEGENSEQK